MNKNIQEAINFAAEKCNTLKFLIKPGGIIYEYWNDKNVVTWDVLCKYANIKATSRHISSKIALCILIYFLDNDLYHDKHKKKLNNDLPLLKGFLNHYNWTGILIFENNYDELYFINLATKNNNNKIILQHIKNADNYFGSIYLKYLANAKIYSSYRVKEINHDFLLSIEGLKISSIDDINSTIFWHQVNYFKNKYEDEKTKDTYLKALFSFYRWMVKEYNDKDFFKDSINLTTEILFSNTLSKNINDNVYFTTLSSTEDLGDKSKVLFIIRNLNNKSTRITKNSYFKINQEKITTSEYRKIILKYFQNATTSSLLTCTGQENYILDSLHFIEKIKEYENYPNSDKLKFNTTEAIMIRDYFKKCNPNIALSTLNNKIGAIRRFLMWCKENNHLTFDTTFFDYLSQYEEPNKFQGEAIPDEDLIKINKQFIKICKEDETYKLYYAIFLILLETEFRVSQVCNLTTSSIQPTLKIDQYLLYSNTKTSVGRKITQPICLSTKRILETVIEETENLRKDVVLESYRDHIFLRKSYIGDSVKGINAEKFLDVFKQVCKDANVRQYNSRNIRDTHMTKAFEHIMRNGKSDLEMNLLSKHSKIDTTKSHYIEIELTKMLESTYHITLGNRDFTQKSKIFDAVPKELNSNSNVVEGGCGVCNAKACNMTGSLPCLICKHFITTVKHKPYFVKMIDNCDTLLSKATIRHEIEDLTLIKSLYVNWLREICIKEEENDAIKHN